MHDLDTIGTIGGAGFIVGILGIVTRLWLTSEKRHGKELTRVNTAHDAELEELRRDIRELRDRQDKQEAALDEERRLRRKAEDEAWRAIRGERDDDSA